MVDNTCNTLFKLMMETKSSLDNCMLKIISDQSKVHDEITSIEKRISLDHSKTQNNVEYLMEKSVQMHTEEYHGPCPEGVTIYPGFDKESSMIN